MRRYDRSQPKCELHAKESAFESGGMHSFIRSYLVIIIEFEIIGHFSQKNDHCTTT